MDVKFDGDNVLLITNKEIHSINNKHIVQVKEDFSTCITYIKYDDGIIKKDFKYQKGNQSDNADFWEDLSSKHENEKYNSEHGHKDN